MNSFLFIMAAHIATTALGGLIVYRRGATPITIAALAAWALLFFPVAYNVVKFF